MVDQVAERANRKYTSMLRRRDGMKAMYRNVSKFVLMRQSWFGDSNVPNRVVSLTVKGVSDDTAVDAARAAATAFGGALWPNAEESFETVANPLMKSSPAYSKLLKAQAVREYYKEATQRIRQSFSSEDAGFLIAWGEHMDEQIALGTSGIVVDEDLENDADPVYFRSISVETSLIDENSRNRVDTVAFEYWLTARQAVEKYGASNVSKATADAAKIPENEDTPIKIIHLIQPRKDGKVGEDVMNKPFSSIHYEAAELKTVLNSGLDELGSYVVRFRRRPGELYGRSLAMDAMPTICELNVIRRAFSLALGKQLDPPSGFWSSMFGGVGSIDLSMGVSVPLFDNGSVPQGRPPVEQFMQIPEPRIANDRLKDIEEKILVKFLLDKLLDFNNKTRMTLGEAQLRNDFRNQALGNLFARQMTELLYPLIMQVIRIYWRRGLLGLHPVKDAEKIARAEAENRPVLVMPEVVAEFFDKTGQMPFSIRFTSPAARAMRADALLGLEKLSNYVLALVGAGFEDARDGFDVDQSVELYQHHVGAPQDAIRSQESRDEVREARVAAQQQMAELAMQEQGSQIAKNAAKAAKDGAQAGLPPGGALSV